MLFEFQTASRMHPKNACVKTDWYITYLGYLHAGFNIRCNFLKTQATHYDNQGGLGSLTASRQAAENRANKLMVKLPLVSSIRHGDYRGKRVTSIYWKNCVPRVIWDKERFVLNEAVNEAEDSKEDKCEIMAAAQGWLARAKRKRGQWYDLNTLQKEWSAPLNSLCNMPLTYFFEFACSIFFFFAQLLELGCLNF